MPTPPLHAPSSAAVLDDVRDFYERIPYPPPVTHLEDDSGLAGYAARRRVLFHQAWPTDPQRGNLEILIAGCGTSQAARYALREPSAHVTAIDVSETSLRHTGDLQRKHQLRNLELHQLPIERLDDLHRSFDLIVCTGVLHHLPDPDVGLRALRAALKPEGAMRLMVYAPYGRAGIYMMQAFCRLLGMGSAERDVHELAAALGSLPADHPIASIVRKAKDFREPAAIADALLHPLDRAYTVPELYAWLERCGMSFGRWIEQAPYLAACGLVARSPYAARLAGLPPDEQYAAVELFRGTMASHSFVAYRDDRPDESQPITFAGERWRAYVPIPMPWTVRVPERAGTPRRVAVLINRLHKFTDLALPIDRQDDRVLAAIDGTRTLADVLASAALEGAAEHRSLAFVERLWQHDHIVFDGSRAGEPAHSGGRAV